MSVKMIPRISRHMVESINKVPRHADVVVTYYNEPAFRTVIKCLRSGQTPIDLVRIQDQVSVEGQYDGLYW